jgi:serine/threonine protein kinase
VTRRTGLAPGTRQYKAPEQLHTIQAKDGDSPKAFLGIKKRKDVGKKPVYYGTEVDIWAAGVTLYAMCHGYLPFQGDEDDRTIDKAADDNRNQDEWNELDHQIVFGAVLCKESFISKTCITLIHQMLEKHKSKRILVEQILNHPWLRKADFSTADQTFQIYRPEEIKFIKEEYYEERKRMNADIPPDEVEAKDLMKRLLEE